ncbi:response regulator [Nodosilinea nodulosa]|uniref:response regulator n=1 Tax=Nodosilinea nodulosa TaxID=416001 RepID=UPI0002E191C5|nr:response regulator [Nodosilinea nodulosa]
MSTCVATKHVVLSVDDSLISQQMIKRALDTSYRVLLADNAVDALSVISQETVGAILLDISMPGIDGFELCRTVRSLPRFKNVPIVMVTSRDTEADRQEARLSGASGYLTKPCKPERLKAVMGKLLPQTQGVS